MTPPQLATPRTEQEAEVRQLILDAYTIAALLRNRGPALEELLTAMHRAEALAPLLDPTAWLAKGDAMREDKSVVAILVDAVRALEQLPWPEPTR